MTVLTMRYSRKASDGKDLYIGSTMILTSEVIKFFLCFLVLLLQKSGSIPQAANTFCNEVLKKPAETVKLSIPSTLYTIQNNLIILALSNLDAATFQVHMFSQRP
jgi:UDP-sugar transporter A1/2/3